VYASAVNHKCPVASRRILTDGSKKEIDWTDFDYRLSNLNLDTWYEDDERNIRYCEANIRKVCWQFRPEKSLISFKRIYSENIWMKRGKFLSP